LPKDYEVFEPYNEHIARIIVGILEARGYVASYQIGYPKNKVLIIVDSKEEADRISGVISEFMEKYGLTVRELSTDRFNKLSSKLKRLIPKASKRT
jgi:hypothetical protein